MEEKEHLIKGLDEARENMRAIIKEIDTTWEIYPGWTVKHVLAHITGWDDAVIASLRAHVEGYKPDVPARRGIDYYNAQTVASREDLDYSHVVAEWEHTREQLKAVINEIPFEKLEGEFVLPWGPTGSTVNLIEVMIEHEHEHADEIRAMMA